MNDDQKTLKSKLIRWFSWQSGREAGPSEWWPKTLEWELEKDSRQPRNLHKNRQSDIQKRANLLFLRGCQIEEMMTMMLMRRWEPLCCHQKHWVLKNLFSRPSIYSSPLISADKQWGLVGAGNRRQHDTSRQSQLGSQLPARLNTLKQGLQSLRLFCDQHKQIKADFCIYWRYSYYQIYISKISQWTTHNWL